MLFLLFFILLIVMSIRYSFCRYITALLMIIIILFGQVIIIVGNNMTPNLNIADTVVGVRPQTSLLGYKMCNLAMLPGIGNLFKYSYGDVVVVKSNIQDAETEIIHPRIIRVVAMPGDRVILQPKSWILKREGKKDKVISYKKYGAYCYERIDNKAYLVMPGMRQITEERELVIPNDSILCMYDNRYNPEQGTSELLIKQNEVYCIPIINLTNIKHYYEFFIK